MSHPSSQKPSPFGDIDTSEDAEIVEVLNQVSNTPGTAKASAEITWGLGVSEDRPQPMRGKWVLWYRLNRKLSPQEWKPLLAASQMYFSRFQRKRRTAGTIFWLTPLTLTAGFYVYFLTSLFAVLAPPGPCHGQGCGGILWIVPTVIFASTIFIAAPYFRRLKLEADKRVAEELGLRAELIDSLRKIDDVLYRPRPIHPYLTWSPTIPRRIRNLGGEYNLPY